MGHTRVNGVTFGEWLRSLKRNRKTARHGDRQAFEAGLTPEDRRAQEIVEECLAQRAEEKARKEAPLISKDREFMVPSPVGLALMSDRPELFAVAIRSAKEGQIDPTTELVVELFALCANLQSDRNEARDKLARFREFYEELVEHHQSMVRLMDMAESEL